MRIAFHEIPFPRRLAFVPAGCRKVREETAFSVGTFGIPEVASEEAPISCVLHEVAAPSRTDPEPEPVGSIPFRNFGGRCYAPLGRGDTVSIADLSRSEGFAATYWRDVLLASLSGKPMSETLRDARSGKSMFETFRDARSILSEGVADRSGSGDFDRGFALSGPTLGDSLLVVDGTAWLSLSETEPAFEVKVGSTGVKLDVGMVCHGHGYAVPFRADGRAEAEAFARDAAERAGVPFVLGDGRVETIRPDLLVRDEVVMLAVSALKSFAPFDAPNPSRPPVRGWTDELSEDAALFLAARADRPFFTGPGVAWQGASPDLATAVSVLSAHGRLVAFAAGLRPSERRRLRVDHACPERFVARCGQVLSSRPDLSAMIDPDADHGVLASGFAP